MSYHKTLTMIPSFVNCKPKKYPGTMNSNNHRVIMYLLMYCGGIDQNTQLVIIPYHLRDDKNDFDVQAYSIIF